MSEKQELLTTNRKALTINLDGTHYGTIAEIGASLRAGTNCGSCRPEIGALLARARLTVAAE